MKEYWRTLASGSLLCSIIFAWPAPGEEFYGLSFSTYIGGANWEHARDIYVDANGNVYICGGTASRDFPTTPGAYDRTFNFGDTSGEECDAFVCKFGPNGGLIWSTYLGGPGYDRAYGIEVDAQGYVYVAGRAGRNFPTTPGSFQPAFQGYNSGGYGGYQNAFVAKLSPEGATLAWASYVGVSSLCRDIAIDAQGDIYLPLGYPNKGNSPPAEWFRNAFQKVTKGGTECGAVKVASDGSNVLWGTWLGGSADDSEAASIRVDTNGFVSLYLHTLSTDMPTTAGAFDRTYNGSGDGFVARFASGGGELAFGSYIGGSTGEEWISTHNLAVDLEGNVYVATQTGSSDFPTTTGVVQRTPGGGSDMAVAKFSPTGALLAATYLGGRGGENPDGVYVGPAGHVFLSGQTSSDKFPVTSNAYQKTFGGNNDAVLVRLSGDLTQLLYSTYIGGVSYDNGRSGFMSHDGSLYVTGSVDGAGWPARNAYQSTFAGGPGDWGAGDAILAKFVPPNPALRISAMSLSDSSISLSITNLTEGIPYSVQGAPELVPSGLWTDVHSFTSNSPFAVWGDPLSGREKGFYRVRSGR